MSNHYYHTCPNCGCNLDPGEICDCTKEPKPMDGGGFLKETLYPPKCIVEETVPEMYPELYATSDALIIGYDRSKGLDMACLTVGRRNHDHIVILKELIGMEAIKAYENLTMGPCIKYDPQMEEFLLKNFNIPKK